MRKTNVWGGGGIARFADAWRLYEGLAGLSATTCVLFVALERPR